jgi:hypothetical protein
VKDPLHRPLVEVTVAAPADEVWRALRDPARIAQWFGWDTETLADEIAYIFHEHATPDDAARILRFGLGDWYEVEPRGEACVVRVVRAAPAADHDWDDIFEDMTQGWIAFTQQLRFALERHAHDARRTIFLSGIPRDQSAAAALGLPASPAGTAYVLDAPTGDRLTGQIWHRGKHQVGATVDGFGDGLIVALDRAPSAEKRGASSITITTYGLADDAFAALEARWRAWWAAHFTVAAPDC